MAFPAGNPNVISRSSNDANFPSISTIIQKAATNNIAFSSPTATWLKSTTTYSDVASCYPDATKKSTKVSGRQIGSIYSSQMNDTKSDLLNAARLVKIRDQKAENNSKSSRLESNHDYKGKNIGTTVDDVDNDDDDLEIKMILEDERSDRAKANILCFERLYRRVFCADTSAVNVNGSSRSFKDSHSSCKNRIDDGSSAAPAASTSSSLHLQDNKDIRLNELRETIRFQCRPLTKEALIDHVNELMSQKYSLSYIFAYIKHLRRKYRGQYPIFENERRVFNRSILRRFHKENARKLGTDEVYSVDEDTYTKIRDWCLRYVFDDELTIHNKVNTRKTNMRFVYVFLMMYYTGKRVSELVMLSSNDIARLLTEKHIAIHIPKSRKLGRLSMRVVGKDELDDFVGFLKRFLFLTRDLEDSPYLDLIPFDQFQRRKSLNRCFDRVYTLAVQRTKPRGLSFHSLRRRKAAVSFQQGVPLDHIREILDHSSTYITNHYINRHLVRTYRSSSSAVATTTNDGNRSR